MYEIDGKKIPKLIKIILVGETSVGKTSIFNKYCRDEFDEVYNSTVGVDFEIKAVNYKNKEYSIQIFDTVGQERFKSIINSYFRMGDGYFVIFDLTNKHSLESVPKWLEAINEHVENPRFIILGNKDDLKNDKLKDNEIYEVLNKIENFSNKYYYKVSAKEKRSINNVFNIMIDFLEKDNLYEEDKATFVIRKTRNDSKEKGKRCC